MNGAKDDVGIFGGDPLHDRRSLVDLMEREFARTRNVQQDSLRPVDRGIFEQRTGNRFASGLDGAALTPGDRRPHHRVAHARHDGPDVGEVAVDDPGDGNDIGDALHALQQDLVRDAKRLEETRALVHELHQALVGNADDRVDRGREFRQRLLGLQHAPLALESEGLGHDRHGQRAEFERQGRHDWHSA